MPHKVIFARHWHLEGKYTDYNNLSFSEMRDLGLNKHAYSIDPFDIPDTVKKKLGDSDICYTSFQNRAIGTAEALGFVTTRKTDVLDEIFFDLFQCMTEEEYMVGKLAHVRIAIRKSFFGRKPGVETPESVMERVQSFISEISDRAEQSITVISHGFFLQMVKCFLVNGVDFTKISYEEFLSLNIGPIGYLENFEVAI